MVAGTRTLRQLMLLAGFAIVAFAAITLFVLPAWKAAQTCRRQGHVLIIWGALRNYAEFYGSLPPAYIADKNGVPMHSWRVLLLPFLEHQELYAQYDFREPWNGPHNRLLEEKMPGVYKGAAWRNHTTTCVLTVLGSQTAWPNAKPLTYQQLVKATASTIVLVELPDANTGWMEPRDITYDELLARVETRRSSGDKWVGDPILCVFAVGGVRSIPGDMSPTQLDH